MPASVPNRLMRSCIGFAQGVGGLQFQAGIPTETIRWAYVDRPNCPMLGQHRRRRTGIKPISVNTIR